MRSGQIGQSSEAITKMIVGRMRREFQILVALLMTPCVLLGCNQSAVTERDSSSRYRELPVRLHVSKCLRRDDLQWERLLLLLQRCEPHHSMAMPDLLHCLRLQPTSISTSERVDSNVTRAEVLSCILDHEKFVRRYGMDRPFLISTRYGARFSEKSWSPSFIEQRTREAHIGQTLSVLSENGIPSKHVLKTDREQLRLSAVLDDALANFNLEQELYWVTVAMALYIAPPYEWENKFGHRFTFDDVAGVLLSRPMNHGPCAGTHGLQTLCVLLQVDDKHGIFTKPDTRDRITSYIRAASASLETAQEADGSWKVQWAANGTSKQKGVALTAPANQAIWITGHHLEWQALAPAELRVSRARIVRAAQYVVAGTYAIDQEVIRQNMCAYSHGLRAIQLMCFEGSFD